MKNIESLLAAVSKDSEDSADSQTDWEAAWKALLLSFALASVYTLLATWIPAIHTFPVATWLGLKLMTDWGWELTPSMGYIGQGMIMGPKTAFSMLAGAVVGEAPFCCWLFWLNATLDLDLHDSWAASGYRSVCRWSFLLISRAAPGYIPFCCQLSC